MRPKTGSLRTDRAERIHKPCVSFSEVFMPFKLCAQGFNKDT